MTSYIRYGIIVLSLWILAACGIGETSQTSQNNNTSTEESRTTQEEENLSTEDPTITPAYETGRLVARTPQSTPTRATELSSLITYDPNLELDELIQFKHEPTGIIGLMPANWTLFEGETSF